MIVEPLLAHYKALYTANINLDILFSEELLPHYQILYTANSNLYIPFSEELLTLYESLYIANITLDNVIFSEGWSAHYKSIFFAGGSYRQWSEYLTILNKNGSFRVDTYFPVIEETYNYTLGWYMNRSTNINNNMYIQTYARRFFLEVHNAKYPWTILIEHYDRGFFSHIFYMYSLDLIEWNEKFWKVDEGFFWHENWIVDYRYLFCWDPYRFDLNKQTFSKLVDIYQIIESLPTFWNGWNYYICKNDFIFTLSFTVNDVPITMTWSLWWYLLDKNLDILYAIT